MSYAALLEHWLKLSILSKVEVVPISFLNVMQTVSGQLRFMEVSQHVSTSKQVGEGRGEGTAPINGQSAGKMAKEMLPSRRTPTNR